MVKNMGNMFSNYTCIKLILRGYTSQDEVVAFMIKMSHEKIKEDILTRYKRFVKEWLGSKGKSKIDYFEIKERIRTKASTEDMVYLYEKLVQEFQHSDNWDFCSKPRYEHQIPSNYWLIVDCGKREIKIQDVKNDFNNILEEIEIPKRPKFNPAEMKKMIKKVYEKVGDNIYHYDMRYDIQEEDMRKPFKYGKDIFIPVAKGKQGRGIDWNYKVKCSNKWGEYENYKKNNWNNKEFIKADEKVNKGSKADVYYCLTSGKFVIPANNELFEYIDKEFEISL